MINIPKFHFLPVIGRSFGRIAKDLSSLLFFFPRLFEEEKRPVRNSLFECPCFCKTQRLITFLVERLAVREKILEKGYRQPYTKGFRLSKTRGKNLTRCFRFAFFRIAILVEL